LKLNMLKINKIIENALIEDIGNGDITSESIFLDNKILSASIVTREETVVCGVEVAERVFRMLDDRVKCKKLIKDGEHAKKGDVILKLKGPIKALLQGERVALNFLQRMCGIATRTKKMVDIVKDYNVKITDTRKTTPGLRILEKYAVFVGGGTNHRFGLDDAVLIKDNHIKGVGGIKKAVELVRKRVAHTTKIEVEVENLEQVEEALKLKVDIILLDNMDIKMLKQAVEMIGNKATTEASGGIDEHNIKEVAATGVDCISIGTLTHHIRSIDLSMMLD